jgi:predicted nucleic acid-binding protein
VNGFLIDTNVVSELMKPRPSSRVVDWIDAHEEQLFHLSVLTLGEIRRGIVQLPPSRRRTDLAAWLSGDLLTRFAGRILQIDQEVADRWGHLAGAKGATMPVMDGLLAATALQHNLTLVTRNTKDMTRTGVGLFNPWSD